MTVPPLTNTDIYVAAPVIRYTGFMTIQMGNTKFVSRTSRWKSRIRPSAVLQTDRQSRFHRLSRLRSWPEPANLDHSRK